MPAIESLSCLSEDTSLQLALRQGNLYHQGRDVRPLGGIIKAGSYYFFPACSFEETSFRFAKLPASRVCCAK